MTTKVKDNLLAIAVFAAVLSIDQFIKYRAILSYNYYLNSGLFFGLLKNNTLAIIISLLLILVCTYFLTIRKIAHYPLTILVAALFSNLLDRFIYHGTVDYWSFLDRLWFNLADIFIILVVALWLTTHFWTKKQLQTN